MDTFYFFAAESGSEGDLFGALGIDWRLLVLQGIAFLILVFLLGKFLFPWLMKQVDERQANVEAAASAATEAKKAVADSQEQVAELLEQARQSAADIVNTAKLESAEIVKNSQTKARQTAERIVEEAHAQIDKDVAAARKALHNDTVELVALATEKIIGSELSKNVDNDRIAKAIQEVR